MVLPIFRDYLCTPLGNKNNKPKIVTMANNKDNLRARIVKEVAEKHNVKTRYVYMVLSGDRNNDEICSDFDDLKRELESKIEVYQDNPLMTAVKELVP